jgi:threonine dehydrogenase-like Zn-dependent dehydrogenase
VAQSGLLITIFAVGMIVGAPLMTMLTLRLPRRLTLMLALAVFAAGHVIVALGSSFTVLLAARFLTRWRPERSGRWPTWRPHVSPVPPRAPARWGSSCWGSSDSALMPSLLTLWDVFGTDYHAAVAGGVNEHTRVTVIGDGAVGLLAVLSAKRLGAEQIILMGRHPARTDLGREFGATDIVSGRGEEGIAQVRELTGGDGTHVVLEAVGNMPAYEQALGIVRPGGVISRVGVPQYEDAPIGMASLFRHNVRLAGGPAPVRAYIEELMPDIINGTIEPGKVLDSTTDLDGVPDGYRAMADRESVKVLVKP